MKMDAKANWSMLVSEASRLMGLGPLIAMMACVVMLILAVSSVQSLIVQSSAQQTKNEMPEFSVKALPAGKAVYEEYAAVLARLSPDVQVSTDKNGIRIAIADPTKYGEFMYVLNSIQGLTKDVIWTASEICLAACAGSASYAVVGGSVERVEVKLRGISNE